MNLQTEIHAAVADSSTSSTTDRDDVKKLRSGDIRAFERIMRRYNQRLYRIARSILQDEHEAMDVVQEAYIKAWYEIHQFKGPDGFASWLSRIAANEALMRLRQSKRIDYTLDDPMHKQPEPKSSDRAPLDALANQQLRKLLEEAIDSLPLENRCVYVMRAIQQLSTRETALSLELTEQAVKTRFMRARQALREVFEEHIEKASLEVHEFAGQRCDSIVKHVLDRLQDKK